MKTYKIMNLQVGYNESKRKGWNTKCQLNIVGKT